jgi:hypothetical protein
MEFSEKYQYSKNEFSEKYQYGKKEFIEDILVRILTAVRSIQPVRIF